MKIHLESTNKKIPSDRLLFKASGPYRIFVRDPIDGGLVLRSESREEMFEWCEENCRARYWIGMGFASFEDEDDSILFRLRWS